MSLFNVNAKNARLERFIPKHGKSEDAPRSAELQFRNVHVLPSAAAAVLLAEDGGKEIESSFLIGDPPTQRFFGIENVISGAEFKARHQLTIDGLDGPIRVSLIDKIRIRFEGGPQKLVWADFSAHIEDPSADEVDFFHDRINRDVNIRLEQDADLVEQMRAEAKGMAVKTENGELDFDGKAERHAEQLNQAAAALESQAEETAELPLKTKRKRPASGKRTPASKRATGKKASKKKKVA